MCVGAEETLNMADLVTRCVVGKILQFTQMYTPGKFYFHNNLIFSCMKFIRK